MQTQLNLIKTEYREVEKRVFPRFPFNYLTFKGNERVYEVKNISYLGMQLNLKEGGHQYKPDQAIEGSLHWKGRRLDVSGAVKWVAGSSIGVAFNESGQTTQEIQKFLSVENIVQSMRPLHQSQIEMELPRDLKYWLRADGPMEVFVWQHNDRECSRFQIILMNQFVEWEDGKGLKTGQVITHKEMETPLTCEDEFEVEMDRKVDPSKLEIAHSVVEEIADHLLPTVDRDFLILKLGS